MEKIKVDNLSFSYPSSDKLALDSVSLSIPESEFVVLCGKSGCGKSTLLRHLKKSMNPYGNKFGSVCFDGEEIEEMSDRDAASKIGYVQQNPDNQLVTDKVWHELAFGLESLGASGWVVSLVVDGVINGVGSVLGFTPQMACVFLCLSILEDCGYMARVAFIMDRIFRRFGLSGKSFIPFLISSGCGVPGIMATRTIENEKDRRMTMMTTTAIPCGAKLPVIATISAYILGNKWWVAPLMYFVGIGMVICSCIILKKTKQFAGDPAPFIMELPNYHIPSAKGVLIHVWERVWAFIKKAGTILFLCVVVMWVLSSYGFSHGSFGAVDAKDSLMADIGGAVAFIFKPLGFGTWQAVASSISGFVAKEGIVSTMGVLSGLGAIEDYNASMRTAFDAFFPTTIAAISFLMFNLFDSPCLAAISTVAKEMNNRNHFWHTIIFQNVSAYLFALVVYQLVGLAIGEVAFGVWTVVAAVIAIFVLYLLFRPDPNKKRMLDGSEGAK